MILLFKRFKAGKHKELVLLTSWQRHKKKQRGETQNLNKGREFTT